MHILHICTRSSRRPIPTITLYRYPSGAARGGIFEGHVVVTFILYRPVASLVHYYGIEDKKQK